MSNALSFNFPVFFALLVIIGFLAIIYLAFKRFSASSPFGGSVLDSFSRDITREIQNGKSDPVIGREEEIEQLSVILDRRNKNNAILVGEAGVGKTAIVEGLAQKIVKKEVPKDLENKRVLALDINALMAGTKYRGDFESRMKNLMDELTHSGKNIILFIDEIHNLMVMENSSENLSIGDILKPAMARSELQIIGATTPVEFEKYFQNDPAFERRLQPIMVRESTPEETLAILKGLKEKYAAFHKIQIPDDILPAVIKESARVLPDRSFPDKAIDILDEAASSVKIEHSEDSDASPQPILTAEDIRQTAQKYAQSVSH